MKMVRRVVKVKTNISSDMPKFSVFKDATWNWQKDFCVPNLLGFQMSLLKFNGQWPLDFKKFLPNFLSFLSVPLVKVYLGFWSVLALHLAIFFIIKLFQLMYADDSTIPEVTNAFIQSVIYGFSFYTTVHFQWYHKDLAEIVDFMIENFKMRSARGRALTLPQDEHDC